MRHIVIGEREYRGTGIGKKLYLPSQSVTERWVMISCTLAKYTISISVRNKRMNTAQTELSIVI